MVWRFLIIEYGMTGARFSTYNSISFKLGLCRVIYRSDSGGKLYRGMAGGVLTLMITRSLFR